MTLRLTRRAAALLLAPTLALAAPPPVSVSGAVADYTLPSLPAVIYLTLTNEGGAALSLTGASSPACATLEVHKSMTMNGMAMMAPAGPLAIAPGAALVLAPGGYHLMCDGPRMSPGQPVALVLHFAGGADLALSVPVRSAGAQ
jgi:copper(I)-binding protein